MNAGGGIDDAPPLSSGTVRVPLALTEGERHGYAIIPDGDARTDGDSASPREQPSARWVHPTGMIVRAAPKVRVFRTAHPPRQSLPAHEHGNAYLSIVIEGDYVEQVGARAVHCRPLQIRFHPPGEVHANHFGVRGGHVPNLELDEIWNDAHPEWSISRVAVEAGFTDHSHLSREFRRVVGVAPSRLRRAMASLRAATAAR